MKTKVKTNNITFIGLGYVGLSNLLLFSQKYLVNGIDTNKEKIQNLNKGVSPIKETEIKNFLSKYYKNIKFFPKLDSCLKTSSTFVICTPTNFNEKRNSFDTSSIELIVKKIVNINSDAKIVIKSTVPVGFTQFLKEKYSIKNIIFCPEFLREGKSLYDNLNPTRIIVGGKGEFAKEFAKILRALAKKRSIGSLITSSTEAESIKLFSNTYLAMRIAFFNELDSFSIDNGLNSRKIIKGVCLDPRIGNYYNNPSFGYGGYCLPKDTKQLLSQYKKTPSTIVKATINSNQKRKKFISNKIQDFDNVGIYRLIMKKNSGNLKESSVIEILKLLNNRKKDVVIYEPLIKTKKYLNFKVVNNLTKFKKNSDIIVANRIDAELVDVSHKVFSRDLFKVN